MPDRRFRTAVLAVVGAALVALLAGASASQAQVGPGPGGRAPYASQQQPRNKAGHFDYYALVLSWSPTFCATQRRGGDDPQCNPRGGRSYSFVLHGVWPQYNKGWPQDCRTQWRPFVPRPVIENMLDIMPSKNLVIHEYRKHGTCSGLEPADYFKFSRRLYDKVKIPPRYVGPNAAFTVSPSEVIRDFTSVNPGMRPDNIAVACGGRGNQVREIRICFSREGTFRRCGENEEARRLCRASKMYVPPARAGGSGKSGSRRGN
ncbi:MAG: ribonuclease T2 family protein [Hyphomicrobiaceae bacterium]